MNFRAYKLLPVIASALVSGCIAFEISDTRTVDRYVDWNMLIREEQRESTGCVSIGLFPGGGDCLCSDGWTAKNVFGATFAIPLVGSCFTCMYLGGPILVNMIGQPLCGGLNKLSDECKGEGFSLSNQDLAQMIIIGYIYDEYAFRKHPLKRKRDVDIVSQECLLTPYDVPYSSVTGFPCYVSSNKTKMFFEFPEYSLLRKVVTDDGEVDVIGDAGLKIHRITLSEKYTGELKVVDREFDDQPIVGAIANLVERLRGCERYTVEMNECLQRGTLDDVAKQPITDKTAGMLASTTNALQKLRDALMTSKIENDALNGINDEVAKIEDSKIAIDEAYALALNNKSEQERRQSEQATKTGKGFSVGGAIGLGAWLGFQHLIKAAAKPQNVLLILLL